MYCSATGRCDDDGGVRTNIMLLRNCYPGLGSGYGTACYIEWYSTGCRTQDIANSSSNFIHWQWWPPHAAMRHAHAPMRPCTHARAPVHPSTHVRASVHAPTLPMHSCTRAPIHQCTHAPMRPRTTTCRRMHRHPFTQPCVRARTHSATNKQTNNAHAYVHTELTIQSTIHGTHSTVFFQRTGKPIVRNLAQALGSSEWSASSQAS